MHVVDCKENDDEDTAAKTILLLLQPPLSSAAADAVIDLLRRITLDNIVPISQQLLPHTSLERISNLNEEVSSLKVKFGTYKVSPRVQEGRIRMLNVMVFKYVCSHMLFTNSNETPHQPQQLYPSDHS